MPFVKFPAKEQPDDGKLYNIPFSRRVRKGEDPSLDMVMNMSNVSEMDTPTYIERPKAIADMAQALLDAGYALSVQSEPVYGVQVSICKKDPHTGVTQACTEADTPATVDLLITKMYRTLS